MLWPHRKSASLMNFTNSAMRDVWSFFPAITAPASTILPFPSISRSINAILFIGYCLAKETKLTNNSIFASYQNNRGPKRFKGCHPHALLLRYPHPKSLPSGKGLTLALTGSNHHIFLFLRLERLIMRVAAIKMKVNASDTGRASQIPGVPATWGMMRNDGTRKTSPRANE